MPHSQDAHTHRKPNKQQNYLTNPYHPHPIPSHPIPNETNTNPLPPKLPLFQSPEHRKTNGTERESQLEAHVAPIARIADPLAYGADEPHLRHAHDGAEDPEAEGEYGGDAGWEQARVVPDGDVVFALLEDEVLGQGDAFIDG